VQSSRKLGNKKYKKSWWSESPLWTFPSLKLLIPIAADKKALNLL